MYQAISAHAEAVNHEFVSRLEANAMSYAATEAANSVATR
jgi:hypothetical protein